MKVITENKYEFTDGNGGVVIVPPFVLTEIPDICANDFLFIWAKADGSLSVVEETIYEDKPSPKAKQSRKGK